MGAGFKVGQKVRATRDTVSWGHERIRKGEELFVGTSLRTGTPYRTEGELMVGRDKDFASAFLVDPLHFEPVPTGPQWSDVDFGDSVTVRLKVTGEKFATVAYRDGHSPNTPHVLGRGVGAYFLQSRFELVSIEKPKPQPPSTPGSHVTVPFPWESGVNHLFLLDSGKWASQTGLAFWPPEDVASKDFTVIHDAGGDS